MGQLNNRQVTIIGCGVAGLTSALALVRHGAQVTMYERASALTELGAGLQISPNAGFVFEALGINRALDAVSARSTGVVLHDQTGKQIASLPFKLYRPDNIFRMIHRMRLIEVLERAARTAGVEIILNHEITEPFPDTSLLIGADGLHSRVRSSLNGPEQPFFTGQTAWRALVTDDIDDPFARIFMGPGRHLVSYPIGGGLRNIVAVTERPEWIREGWSYEDDPANLQAAFSMFNDPVPGWLSQVKRCGIWGLFRHRIARTWHSERCVILGDAAHPTLPFMAQGAVMAIEDAWILAECLNSFSDQSMALARFQKLRQPRVRKIVEAANKNARNYHLTGPKRMIGHTALRTVSRLTPHMLSNRFNWIYDYNPLTECILD